MFVKFGHFSLVVLMFLWFLCSRIYGSAVFPSKIMHVWHPVSPEEIGCRWEQFHDCFLPATARKWCPWWRVLSHKTVPQKGAYLGNVLILRNSFLSMRSCQKCYILCLFDASFVCTKEGRPLGGSSGKLLELMLVSWFSACVNHPHKRSPLQNKTSWLLM
jgi:hypothetical protein